MKADSLQINDITIINGFAVYNTYNKLTIKFKFFYDDESEYSCFIFKSKNQFEKLYGKSIDSINITDALSIMYVFKDSKYRIAKVNVYDETDNEHTDGTYDFRGFKGKTIIFKDEPTAKELE